MGLITPEQMRWNAERNMRIMATIDWIEREDAEARATPVGGMQYRLGVNG